MKGFPKVHHGLWLTILQVFSWDLLHDEKMFMMQESRQHKELHLSASRASQFGLFSYWFQTTAISSPKSAMSPSMVGFGAVILDLKANPFIYSVIL